MNKIQGRLKLAASLCASVLLITACAQGGMNSYGGSGSGGSTMSGSATRPTDQPMPSGMSGSTGASSGSGNAITGGAEAAPTDQATPRGMTPGGTTGGMGTMGGNR